VVKFPECAKGSLTLLCPSTGGTRS